MNRFQPWLHRFAVLTALATLGLVGLGGLVTSHEAGMSVPDWPTSYGYNMFALPFRFWSGGVFYEHTHRLWASTVGLLVVVLARWLGGRAASRPLLIVGVAEILAGIGVFALWPNLKGTGHFLTGIGGVVLLAGFVWAKNAPANRTLVKLGWTVFWLVQFQGLLGGLRVVLFKDQIGILHAALAQIFFGLTCVIAMLTSRWWGKMRNIEHRTSNAQHPIKPLHAPALGVQCSMFDVRCSPLQRRLFLFTTILIFLQLLIAATMRHQHAGLAISDFPLAHGRLWPDTSAEAVAHYNQQRTEITGINPITAFQIQLQMAHRLMAVLILLLVALCAVKARSGGAPVSDPASFGPVPHQAGSETGAPIRRLTIFWLGLILVQVALGAATVLTDKAADIATAHVMVGALSLATGVLLCIISARSLKMTGRAPQDGPVGEKTAPEEISFAARTSAS